VWWCPELQGRDPRRSTLNRHSLILRSVVSSRSPRVTRLFRYGGAVYKFLYGGAPHKFCVRTNNANSVGGPPVTRPRAEVGPQPAGCMRRKIVKKSPPTAAFAPARTLAARAAPSSDIRASRTSRPPRVTHIFTHRKIKLRRSYVMSGPCVFVSQNSP
jgi:hypothetical protein